MSLAGRRLGPYDIIALLGAGGMGEVYRARDSRLGREVAIKVLPADVADDAAALARFEREARAVASLSHPNILSIFDIGEHGGLRFAVMELIDGQTLRALLADGPLPPRRALDYGAQIADALAAAHDRGVVHRDVKPENVIVTPDGRVKVLDFGLAKTAAAAPADMATAALDPQTGAGQVLGTVGYMSPEQVRGLAADHRSDIFSLGIVLYEMLGGRRAFVGGSAVETMHAILRDEPPQLSSSGVPVLPAIEQVVAHCLEKNAAARFQSARDLVFALRTTAQTTSSVATPPLQAGAPISRREMLAWSAAGLASAALVPLALRSSPRPHTGGLVRFNVVPSYGATRDRWDAFALSPDGAYLVFRAQEGGKYRLWLRALAATESEPIKGSEDGDCPFWSPDSRSIGFFTSTALMRLDLRAGAPQRICAVTACSGGAWCAGDVIVFGDTGRGLFRVSAGGGSPQPLTTLDASARERDHAWPQPTPGGAGVVFLAMTDAYDHNQLWLQKLDGSPRTALVKSPLGAVVAGGYLLRRPSAGPDLPTLMAQPIDAAGRLTGAARAIHQGLISRNTGGVTAASASETGVLAVSAPDIRQSLVWMDRAGRELGRLGGVADIWSFALAPDESRVAVAIAKHGEERPDVWLLDPKRTGAVQLTFRGGIRPHWTRDGRRIIFNSYDFDLPMAVGVGNGVYALTPGMPGAQALGRRGPVLAAPCDAAPDGKTLIGITVAGTPAIVAIDMATGTSRALIHDDHGVVAPCVSPDGKWIAYTVLLPNRAEVCVEPFAGGGVRAQLSVDGGFAPVWRDDGRELYYQSFDEMLMRVELKESGGLLNAAAVEPLFHVRTGGLRTDWVTDVVAAGHGQKFLVCSVLGDSDNMPIEITMNWPALLKGSAG